MVAYRFYCLDGAGSIQLADWIDAATDEEAVRQARELRKDFAKCEVWHKPSVTTLRTDRPRLQPVCHTLPWPRERRANVLH